MVAACEQKGDGPLYELLNEVCDPEIPVLTLRDLGVLRDISIIDGEITVTITPTYAGCPALHAMRSDIETALSQAGYKNFVIKHSLTPAWTTDWMSEDGRRKLHAYGIAPPALTRHDRQAGTIECPQCGSISVEKISEFGTTACKALYRCKDCQEPFDYFKCL